MSSVVGSAPGGAAGSASGAGVVLGAVTGSGSDGGTGGRGARAVLLPGKAPRAGRTKTRLSPPLSPEEAAALYRGFLRDSVSLALSLGWEGVTLAHSEPAEAAAELAALLPRGVAFVAETGGELGAVLRAGFDRLLAAGFDRVVLIGSDNPTLPPAVLERAARALDDHDAVIGPTPDGGYYLLGLRRPQPGLFEGIAWSTSVVYEQTLARARELGLRVLSLPEWYDVDTGADLRRLEEDLAGLPPSVAPETRAVLAHLAPAPWR